MSLTRSQQDDTMSDDEVISDKKKGLLAYKQKLINEINAFNKKIGEVKRKEVVIEEDDSSDSDTGLPTIITGLAARQLRGQEAELKTLLMATEELTSLQVFESEVNIMVEPPTLEHGIVAPSSGTWREVTAECRVDLVLFSITFHVHQENKPFAPKSFYNLSVVPVKKFHEKELSTSVLVGAKRPSDAVQILRSYAEAHRSRRKSVQRLAEKFGEFLTVDAMENGGYLLKCSNLLEVSWSLQNKWSPIAAFIHRMKFELEYMDEEYIKRIHYAHKQLIDPSLDTDERTQLFSEIIEICLAAHGQRSDFDSNTDTENIVQLVNKNNMLDQEDIPERNGENKENEDKLNDDAEVMAPPKQLPKKGKPKNNMVDKENVNAQKSDKRDEKASTKMSKNEKVTEKGKRSEVAEKENLNRVLTTKTNEVSHGQNITSKITSDNKKDAKKSSKRPIDDAPNTATQNSQKVRKTTDGQKTNENITEKSTRKTIEKNQPLLHTNNAKKNNEKSNLKRPNEDKLSEKVVKKVKSNTDTKIDKGAKNNIDNAAKKSVSKTDDNVNTKKDSKNTNVTANKKSDVKSKNNEIDKTTTKNDKKNAPRTNQLQKSNKTEADKTKSKREGNNNEKNKPITEDTKNKPAKTDKSEVKKNKEAISNNNEDTAKKVTKNGRISEIKKPVNKNEIRKAVPDNIVIAGSFANSTEIYDNKKNTTIVISGKKDMEEIHANVEKELEKLISGNIATNLNVDEDAKHQKTAKDPKSTELKKPTNLLKDNRKNSVARSSGIPKSTKIPLRSGNSDPKVLKNGPQVKNKNIPASSIKTRIPQKLGFGTETAKKFNNPLRITPRRTNSVVKANEVQLRNNQQKGVFKVAKKPKLLGF